MKKLLAVLVVVVAAIAPSPPARSAFPGANGRIAFTSTQSGRNEVDVMNADGSGRTVLAADGMQPAWSPDGRKIAYVSSFQIYVMNADGSGKTRLTNNNGFDTSPAWSPDGTKLAFETFRNGDTTQIYVMNADGTAQRPLTDGADSDRFPAWSPDGRKIAYSSLRDFSDAIYVANSDGSGETRLTGPRFAFLPKWSPDGAKIAYSDYSDLVFDVYEMNADGTGQTRITPTPAKAEAADWSPDGKRFVFTSFRDGPNEIYVMNADGSGQTRLTNDAGGDTDPSWQPLPAADLSLDLGAQTNARTRVVTYAIRAGNAGPSSAADVVVRYTIPAQSRFVAARTSSGRCAPPSAQSPRTVSCDLGSLAAGGTGSVAVVVRFSSRAKPRRTRITGTAEVASVTSDPNAANNSASVTTTIRR